MATSVDLIVTLLPHPYKASEDLEADAICMKEHRLEALQTDPASFSSDYAYESKQHLEFWKGRLKNPMARHLVISESSNEEIEVEKGLKPLRSPWAASMVLYGPQIVKLDTFMEEMTWKSINEGSLSSAEKMAGTTLLYYIMALYVKSRFRRNGIAKKLTLAAIDTIQKEVREVKAANAICMVGHNHKNAGAHSLYESLGWKSVSEDRFLARDGRNIIGIQMRLDIEL